MLFRRNASCCLDRGAPSPCEEKRHEVVSQTNGSLHNRTETHKMFLLHILLTEPSTLLLCTHNLPSLSIRHQDSRSLTSSTCRTIAAPADGSAGDAEGPASIYWLAKPLYAMACAPALGGVFDSATTSPQLGHTVKNSRPRWPSRCELVYPHVCATVKYQVRAPRCSPLTQTPDTDATTHTHTNFSDSWFV
jgi:hypothetical protein